jgi:hypothetical protein
VAFKKSLQLKAYNLELKTEKRRAGQMKKCKVLGSLRRRRILLAFMCFLGFIVAYGLLTTDALAQKVTFGIARGLPKTGQTASYQAADDGDYEKGWSGTRFTNNGDGTITDNATGLMWIANPAANPPNIGGTYTWSNAITTCENLTYAGYSDWRLPNVKELQSIVDYSKVNPSIDTDFFTSQSDLYWSSTTNASNTSNAWYAYFDFGYVFSYGKINASYIRPVRGGQ